MRSLTTRWARPAAITAALAAGCGLAWAQSTSEEPPRRGGGTFLVEASCQAPVAAVSSVEGTSELSGLQARHAAITQWRDDAERRFGFEYSQWWKAMQRSVSCRVGDGATHCEAKATPCQQHTTGLPNRLTAF